MLCIREHAYRQTKGANMIVKIKFLSFDVLSFRLQKKQLTLIPGVLCEAPADGVHHVAWHHLHHSRQANGQRTHLMAAHVDIAIEPDQRQVVLERVRVELRMLTTTTPTPTTRTRKKICTIQILSQEQMKSSANQSKTGHVVDTA